MSNIIEFPQDILRWGPLVGSIVVALFTESPRLVRKPLSSEGVQQRMREIQDLNKRNQKERQDWLAKNHVLDR